MPFALLDDQFHSNPKVISMGLDGAGLYARALSYIADYQTDGFVPESWVTGVLEGRRKLANHLGSVGAWESVEPGDELRLTDRSGNEIVKQVRSRGFFVADYCQFNPSSVELESQRKKKSRAGKKGAVKRWGDNTSHSTPMAEPMAPANGTSHGRTIARARAAQAQDPHPNPEQEQQQEDEDLELETDHQDSAAAQIIQIEAPRQTRIAEVVQALPGIDVDSLNQIEPLALQLPAADFEAVVATVTERRTAHNPPGLLIDLLRTKLRDLRRSQPQPVSHNVESPIERLKRDDPTRYLQAMGSILTTAERDTYLNRYVHDEDLRAALRSAAEEGTHQ